MFDYDLFISYKSDDRPWAVRLYQDLRRDYPLLKVFWDRTGIPAGASFRPVLEDAIQKSVHMIVLWTGVASQSGEVIDELKAFDAHRKLQPVAGKAKRSLFYVPLEGTHTPLEGTQGFAEFRRLAIYDTTTLDRGTARLAEPAVRVEWQRMIREVGDACMAGYTTQPVTLAILAMNENIVPYLDQLVNLRVMPGPTLSELLTAIDTTLDTVKTRYGPGAYDWHPFGTAESVIDFMDRLRVEANSALSAEYRFHWAPMDLYAEVTKPGITSAEVNRVFEQLAATPSVVIVDQVSLYNPLVYQIFAQLGDYARKEQAVIISFAPAQTNATDSVLQSIVGRGAPVLNAYFEPQIPAAGTFARCGVNVQHPMDVKRLVRSSLGLFFVQQKKLQGEHVTKGG